MGVDNGRAVSYRARESETDRKRERAFGRERERKRDLADRPDQREGQREI